MIRLELGTATGAQNGSIQQGWGGEEKRANTNACRKSRVDPPLDLGRKVRSKTGGKSASLGLSLDHFKAILWRS
jgi:hypothetical protein